MTCLGSPPFVFGAEATDRGVSVDLGIFQSINDSGLLEVLRAHLHFHDVSNRNLDKVLAQLSGNMSKNLMAILKLRSEHGTGQDRGDLAFDFDNFFSGHMRKSIHHTIMARYVK